MKPLAKDFKAEIQGIEVGVRFFPYRLAFGVAGHYWKDIFKLHITLHFAMFTFWITF